MPIHLSQTPCKLLEQHASLLLTTDIKNGVLDLACGYGRNGLYLARHGIKTVFADRNADALKQVEQSLVTNSDTSDSRCWNVDFEEPGSSPLAGLVFDGIIVFNYLHRPLMPAIADAIRPGGILVYQTFNFRQARLGKPSNPDYLLRDEELLQTFSNFEVLHHFEERAEMNGNQPDAYISQLVARKALRNP